MPRSVATTRTAAARRGSTFNVPYSLTFIANSSSLVTLDTATLLDTTQAWAVAFWVNFEEYNADRASTVGGLFTLKTDLGVPLQGRFTLSQTSTAPYVMFGTSSATIVAKYFTVSSSTNQKIRKGWHHVCITFDGVDRTLASSYAMYLDGTSQTFTTTSALSAQTNTNWIGKTSTYHQKKNMSRFRIWNGGTAMTAAQVASLYYDDTVPSGPTLTREYLFTDGTGTTLTETVGGFNGTLASTTYVNWSTRTPRKTRDAASSRTVAS